MNLAGMTTVARPYPTTSHQQLGRPPATQPVTGGEGPRQHQIPAEQPTLAGDTQRALPRAKLGESGGQPVSASVRPAEPSGQPDWLLASLGGLVAALALVGGLAVLAARRAGRRARVGHAA